MTGPDTSRPTRRRRLLVPGIVWLLAVVVIAALLLAGTVPDLSRVYCTAWLVLISLPLGALPILMALDLVGFGETSVSAPLRLLLASLPVVAVLIVPILLDARHLYGVGGAATGFAAAWLSPGSFVLRAIVYLVIWIVLAAFFVRPEPPRRTVAGLGLLIHFIVGTLAAYDWFMTLDVGFVSSVYGVLVIAAQAAFAFTVAAIAALFIGRRAGPDRDMIMVLLVLVGAAAFVQFSQYLVVWSANLPTEIVWYQTRGRDGLGQAFAVVVPLLLAVATVALLPEGFGMRRRPMVVALALLLVAEVADLVLLASPGTGFTVPRVLLDVPFVIGIGGIAAFCALIVAGRLTHRVWHG